MPFMTCSVTYLSKGEEIRLQRATQIRAAQL
jgi:hypothetical protein